MLNLQHRWLQRVRLWRLILSQSPEGWWDASTTTAFALQARPGTELVNLPSTFLSRMLVLFSAAAEEAATNNNALDVLQGHRGGDIYDDMADVTETGSKKKDDDTMPVAPAAPEAPADATRSEALAKQQEATDATNVIDWCVLLRVRARPPRLALRARPPRAAR